MNPLARTLEYEENKNCHIIIIIFYIIYVTKKNVMIIFKLTFSTKDKVETRQQTNLLSNKGKGKIKL